MSDNDGFRVIFRLAFDDYYARDQELLSYVKMRFRVPTLALQRTWRGDNARRPGELRPCPLEMPPAVEAVPEDKPKTSRHVGWQLEQEQPERLRYSRISKVIDTVTTSLRDDPLTHYLRNTPDAADNSFEENWRAIYDVLLLDALRRHEAWTVHDGDAVIMMHTSKETLSQRRKVLDAFLGRLTKYLVRFLMCQNTKEQRRRFRETEEKVPAAVKSALGERLGQMITLNVLATAPGKQGRGYGTTLMKFIIDKADAQVRATYLLSANVENAKFFEDFGFSTVSEVALGEDNPAWGRNPVIIRVMVREPKPPPVRTLRRPSSPNSVGKE